MSCWLCSVAHQCRRLSSSWGLEHFSGPPHVKMKSKHPSFEDEMGSWDVSNSEKDPPHAKWRVILWTITHTSRSEPQEAVSRALLWHPNTILTWYILFRLSLSSSRWAEQVCDGLWSCKNPPLPNTSTTSVDALPEGEKKKRNDTRKRNKKTKEVDCAFHFGTKRKGKETNKQKRGLGNTFYPHQFHFSSAAPLCPFWSAMIAPKIGCKPESNKRRQRQTTAATHKHTSTVKVFL